MIKIDISIASVTQLNDPGAAFHHPPSPSPTDGVTFPTPSPANPYIHHVHHQSQHPYQHPQPPSHQNHGNIPSTSIYQYPSQSPFAHFAQSNPPMQSSGICHQGVSTRDFVLRLCAMNPSIIPLVLVIKQFLQVSPMPHAAPLISLVAVRRRVFMILLREDYHPMR